jgi:Methylamine utilisation protein MauE
LALVLIAAGVGKLLDRPGSRAALQDFGVPKRWSAAGGLLLPFFELAAAAALLIEPLARLGAGLGLLLLAAFCLGIANAMRQGREPDCHCFGQLHSEPAGPATIARNAALAVPAGLVLAEGPGDAPVLSGGDGAALVTVSALAAALGVASAVLLRENRRLRRRVALRDTPEPLDLGTAAPELRLRDTGGSTLGVSEVLDGERPAVLVFVQPDCGACRELVPRLERWRPALAEHLALVLISGPRSVGGPTPEEAGAAPHILWDVENAARNAYRLLGSPSAVKVDPDGTIASAPALGTEAIEALIRAARRRSRPAASRVAA